MGAPGLLGVNKCKHPHIAAKKVMCFSQYYFWKSHSGINSPIQAYCSRYYYIVSQWKLFLQNNYIKKKTISVIKSEKLDI